MGQEGGEKWTAAADLQPTLPKSDRLLDAPFGQIISRAFSDLYEFFHLTRHLAATPQQCPSKGARWLAMKGVHPHEEIAQLSSECYMEQVHRLKVPGLEAERHLVVLRATGA